MRIIAQSRRIPKEVLCDTCGTIFECELTDPLIIKEKDIHGCETFYYVICPTCNAKILLGTNVNKIFPWKAIDFSHGNETPQ